jgi:hypothetical protein
MLSHPVAYDVDSAVGVWVVILIDGAALVFRRRRGLRVIFSNSERDEKQVLVDVSPQAVQLPRTMMNDRLYFIRKAVEVHASFGVGTDAH